MENLLFNLKFTAKQFGKSSKKCEKEEKQEKDKCKTAMEKGNIDGARIYAQNAIRKHNEALNYLRLQSRIDAVASRLDTAIKMRTVSKSMAGVVKGMDKVLETMDPTRISQIMDTFEKQFETLDVTSEYMENAIGSTTALTTPDEEVNGLMAAIADENDLNVQMNLDGVDVKNRVDPLQVQQDELSARLAKLKSQKM
jgi:charged multivesicular body protein 1|eukprot:CAMPEP_0174289846 /NCGR_PEP_ID=MMETSP0809-20121228/26581_1 /TAXON_ID=73025 ORGANISM="Eutreptiella gymnastica-like, Strain CCMP1594" /NCGR_SAMPLE_ID=MMETSP0809 /ASSEMBLY_ACC=CAM_ASM_000658 /LENGTH=196 /DNA_ID=CAMNT_0015388079 /DNA_START=22 /DNA_END=612 /DNA_ORIENTATION=-